MILAIMLLFCIFPMYPHTEADTKMLADVMWLENGHTGKTEAENRECLILTGTVVLNRMKSNDKWLHLKGEKTVYDVIFASGQYAVSTKEGLGKTDTPDWVYELAEDMLNYGTNVPEYVIYQSTQPGLGTHWKKIDGEYFATSGGHKNEGYDMVAEVNSSNGRDLRIFDYVFGSADRAGVIGTSMGHIRWCRYFRSLFSLAMANLQGGGLLYP